jgi:cytidine deaminase
MVKHMLSEAKRDELIRAAIEVRPKAYAPYSNYAVGAALLAASGRVYKGVNVENAAYPLTMCAERSAVFNAVSEGEREFQAIAVATNNGGFPCGSCRQVLSEFGLETLVLIADKDGNLVDETTVRDLLPKAFTPQELDKPE